MYLQGNDTFSVVMNLTAQNTLWPLPVEYAVDGYSSQANATPGQSYYSDDNGQTWFDITESDPTENICFKAFTVLIHPVAGFSAKVFSGHAPLTVEFTDNSTGFPTSWNWSFGDGSFSSAQNPTHTFSSGGAYTITLNVTNAAGTNTLTRPDYIIVNGYKIGVFRSSARQFILNTTPITRINYGLNTDIPLIGDWDGDGLSEIGVFRPSAREFILNTTPITRINYGLNTDIPLIGDWDGDGLSEIGVFRPSAREFILNTIPITRINYGLRTDIPLIGDWNGDGLSEIGVFRPSAREFILNTIPITRINYGLSTDIPLIGDWNGDGLSEIGVFRPSTRQFILDLNSDGIADKRITFGQYTDFPVTGIWI